MRVRDHGIMALLLALTLPFLVGIQCGVRPEDNISLRFDWNKNEPPTRMWRFTEGFCFLTDINGIFEGGGERIALTVEPDGFWYLNGVSQQASLSASGHCVSWAKFAGVGNRGRAERHLVSTAGQSSRALGRDRFCVFAGLSGRFQRGDAETARLHPVGGTHWQLDAKTMDRAITADAMCIPYTNGSPIRATSLHYIGPAAREPQLLPMELKDGICFLAGTGGKYTTNAGVSVMPTKPWALTNNGETHALAICVPFNQTAARTMKWSEAVPPLCVKTAMSFCMRDTDGGSKNVTGMGCNAEEARLDAMRLNTGRVIGTAPCPTCPSGGPLEFVQRCCKETGTTYWGAGCTEDAAIAATKILHTNCTSWDDDPCSLSAARENPILFAMATATGECGAVRTRGLDSGFP